MEGKMRLYTILLAEDDSDDSDIVAEAIKANKNFNNLVLVVNGEELMEYLHSGKPRPDVILTDLNMPKKDGFEALDEISKDALLKDIPFFVYSTSTNPIMEAKCKALGVKCFFKKPFSFTEYANITNVIANYLRS